MRTTEAECAELGRIVARKLNRATGPLTVFIPLGGLSMIDAPGGPFHDPAADAALIRELKAGLRPAVEVVEMATHINDPAFATAMAERLDEHYRAWAGQAAMASSAGGRRTSEKSKRRQRSRHDVAVGPRLVRPVEQV